MRIEGANRDSDMAHELDIKYLCKLCTSHFHFRLSQNARSADSRSRWAFSTLVCKDNSLQISLFGSRVVTFDLGCQKGQGDLRSLP
jgi:hypothetical protein